MRLTPMAALLPLMLLAAAPAEAQQTKLPVVVLDVRAALARWGVDSTTASDLAVSTANMTSSGWAGSAGLHIYPMRWNGIAVGTGVETVISSSAAEGGTDSTGAPVPRVERQFRSAAFVVSVNFGGRDGWSYLSGGTGPLRFQTTSAAIPSETAPTTMTPNVGGGARWFNKAHLAAGFDVRAYLTPAVSATTTSAGRVKRTVFVVSIGVSFR